MKKKSPLVWTALITVALVAGGAWAAKSGGSDSEVKIEGATVQRGPLRISVVERGNLKAAESVTLKSELEGSATVLYLIEEGKHVKAGDVVCELDATQLEDRRVQQEIKVHNAFAALTKAQQNHEIQESQNRSDIARAEQDVEFAKDDLAKFDEIGEDQERKKAEEDITLRREEMERAAQDYEWSKKLYERGFLEKTRLDADELAVERTKIALLQAERYMKQLEGYDIPRRRKELEAAVEETQRELERVKLQAKARIADFVADVQTSEANHRIEKDEYAKLERQISKATLRAPVDGMVVYAVESNSRWGGGEPMQEGAVVRERQEIITIPSQKGYIAETSVHESVLEKVAFGMPCLVTIDALGETFPAEVKFKAVLPDQNSWFANPDLRVYRTEIAILEKDERMRPGMSCSVEILAAELADAVYAPVQAVFLDAGAPIALVSNGANVEKRPIEVGQNNGKWVEIKSGLEEGEIVLLAAPPTMTLQPAVEDQSPVDKSDWPESKVGTTTGGDNIGGEGRGRGGMPGGGAPGEVRGVGAAVQPVDGEHAGAEGAAPGAASAADRAAQFEQWKKDNPEKAKELEEAMKDPEKMRKMREAFANGGGQRGGGGGQ